MGILRDKIEQELDNYIRDAYIKSHEWAFEWLRIDSNGNLYWFKTIDNNIPSFFNLGCFGSGMHPCTCLWCKTGRHLDEISQDELNSEEWKVQAIIYQNFYNIPYGYFDDEVRSREYEKNYLRESKCMA